MRNFCKYFMVLVFALSLHGAAWAADVNVRTGAHAEYSRLVFDWTSRVDYTLERPDKNRLVIKFKKGATLNTSKAESNPVANISGLKILSEEPLSVSVSIPEESRTRDLRAGNKIVVDVYNPPGGAQKKQRLSVSKDIKKPEKKAEKKKEEQVAEKPQEQQAEEETKTVKLEMREQPSLITVSSTEGFGLASFELAGRIWLVNDESDLLLNPQVSGPRTDEIAPLSVINTEAGKVYTAPVIEGLNVKGHGGGVLWRVMMGPDIEEQEGIAPVRSGIEREETRSGKLFWPLENSRKVIDVRDPLTGQNIKVVTVEDAKQFAGQPRSFVDFDVLPSLIGLAIVPKVDDLEVKIVRGGVEIGRTEGLTMVDEKLLASMARQKIDKPEGEEGESVPQQAFEQRIFDFAGWRLGGLQALHDNRMIVLAEIKDLPDSAKTESLLTLAKMYASNAMGPEALGILHFAAVERPGMWDSPEFMALYGVASALSYHNEDAFKALSIEELEPFEEIQYWRSFVLADEEDWQQAAEVMPASVDTLYDYPGLLLNRLTPVLAEVMLRAGQVNKAEELLHMAESNRDLMTDPQKASLTYLKGEAARQQGQTDKTREFWEPLTTGVDDLYRAKAGLALTRLRVNEEELSSGAAIDRLERLRYAWRGDGLEVQIYYWLGRTYFETGDYVKGLKIMREAASLGTGTALGQRVAGEMADVFTELFLGPDLDTLSPLDAIAVYEQFQELVPVDERGNRIVERLAERLAKADLLTRSGDILAHQLEHRLSGIDVYRVGTRLAAIRLLDNLPKKAVEALNRAGGELEKLPEELKTPERYRAISLLRARALSRQGRPDQALAMLGELEQSPDVNRLRADIAWTASYWDDAAEALEDVILDRNISLTRPLETDDMDLLLQRGIALNLASDRIALANMREKYSDLMNQTEKAKVFEVITRPRQSGALADRETLLSVVSEVDLFSDFLESYKAEQPPSN